MWNSNSSTIGYISSCEIHPPSFPLPICLFTHRANIAYIHWHLGHFKWRAGPASHAVSQSPRVVLHCSQQWLADEWDASLTLCLRCPKCLWIWNGERETCLRRHGRTGRREDGWGGANLLEWSPWLPRRACSPKPASPDYLTISVWIQEGREQWSDYPDAMKSHSQAYNDSWFWDLWGGTHVDGQTSGEWCGWVNLRGSYA